MIGLAYPSSGAASTMCWNSGKRSACLFAR
jgi:hypothetical protein